MDADNAFFFSAASFWEIGIKKSLGKISLKSGWAQTIKSEMETNSVQWLPIEVAHCAEVEHLPFHHRDPFDRMLSRDPRFSDYPVERIW